MSLREDAQILHMGTYTCKWLHVHEESERPCCGVLDTSSETGPFDDLDYPVWSCSTTSVGAEWTAHLPSRPRPAKWVTKWSAARPHLALESYPSCVKKKRRVAANPWRRSLESKVGRWWAARHSHAHRFIFGAAAWAPFLPCGGVPATSLVRDCTLLK